MIFQPAGSFKETCNSIWPLVGFTRATVRVFCSAPRKLGFCGAEEIAAEALDAGPVLLAGKVPAVAEALTAG